MLHNSGFDDLFFVTQFVKGLKLEVGSVVQTQIPETMERAILLAKIQQQVLDKGKHKWQKQTTWNRPSHHQPKIGTKPAPPTTSLWKERQVRDYRKTNGLCFYCAEPFDVNHKNVCTKRPQQAQVNALVVNDLDVVLNDDILNQLAVEDALTEDFCQLSLNALSGTEHGDCMKLRALVKNKVMLLLVDSGSSHSFVSQNFLQTVGIKAAPTEPKQVRLANGDLMVTNQTVSNLEWWSNGHTLSTDMKVLQLGAYDAILGYDWLKAHSPMLCDWEGKTLQFDKGSSKVLLKGVLPPSRSLQEISLQKVTKWAAGNDIWAVAVVEMLPTPVPETELPEVQQLLKEFQDVFDKPTELPLQDSMITKSHCCQGLPQSIQDLIDIHHTIKMR